LPLEKRVKNAFCEVGDFIMKFAKNQFTLTKKSSDLIAKSRSNLLKELANSDDEAARESANLRKKVWEFKKEREIWLIYDRINKANHNGEALFRYLSKNPIDADVYFVIRDDTSAFAELSKIGKVIAYGSEQHKLFHLLADQIISSAGDNWVYNQFGSYDYLYKDIQSPRPFVYLNHGLIAFDMSDWLKKYSQNMRGFVTGAKREQDSIAFNEKYGFEKHKIWCTGFPWYDRLTSGKTEKIITIMPTWRKYLVDNMDTSIGIRPLKPGYKNSDYYKFYNSLINSEKLINEAKKFGFTIQFMPHPNMIPHIDMFDHNEFVKFCDISTEYKDIFEQSAFVLTDYSSVVFDFAYLKKPIAYAQFDQKDFFENHWHKGYFSYEDDGFGEVVYNLEDTINLLCDYMKNGCEMKEIYKARVDSFFAFHDKNNCERVLNKILEPEKNYMNYELFNVNNQIIALEPQNEDITNELRAAINEAKNTETHEVYIPAGEFILSEPLVITHDIRLILETNTTLHLVNDANIVIDGAKDAMIYGGAIECKELNLASAIELKSVESAVIKHIEIKNIGESAILAHSCGEVKIIATNLYDIDPQIAKLNAEIDKLKAQNAKKSAQLNKLQASKAYKLGTLIAAPVRKIRKKLKG